MQRLQSVSLREQALVVVRQAIVSGEIGPGAIYSASALATRLGVSNSPVREAMLTLVNQGIMEPVRNRGFRIVPISEHDLDEIGEMRRLLEIPATVALVDRAGDPDIEAHRPVAEEICAAARSGDVPTFLEADRRFHLGLLALGGNTRLVETVARLRDQTRLYGVGTLAEQGTLQDTAPEHFDILDALLARDGDAVRTVMTRHLDHIRGEWAGEPPAEPSFPSAR
ncbi:DNA-binding GntR family transcriptional regulator [Murinocardiopsis flavida]|uniref:DNA-binding GntR family transcriptional regulator n=1 Tax=Murinocardiopsis flavida TaxID=645275 RepID=A0A2P8DEQ6_9ACTN|nr:GntR family transcriptional regulator [Murinocardiopsis flavida]PSK95701.1 DNA-binding GntR family transcriptional regulator [Murinocardiopsis flavida]